MTKEAQPAKKDAKAEKKPQAAETTNGDFSYDNLFDASAEVNVAANHIFDHEDGEVSRAMIRGEETLGFKFYTLLLLEVITLFVAYNLWQQNKALQNTNYRFDLLENQEF